MRVRGEVGTRLRTAAALIVIPVMIGLHSLAAIALGLARVRPARVQRVYVSISRLCLWVGGTELWVRGAERIEPGQAYVVVPNHESSWDPMSIMTALPQLVMRFVAKRQFMQMPLLGQALRLTGNVRVVRTGTKDDVARIHAVMDKRDPEVSILFFAEGTRSRDGGLHPFKLGAFATALGYGLPVLPIGLAGTRHILERSILRLRKGTVAVEVGEPIPVEGLGLEDRRRLRDRTYQAVARLRSRTRQRLRDAGVDPGGVD